MKKELMKGMAVLFASTAFVACSHDSWFDENAAENQLKNEYKNSFEKKYGAIGANQSWDFTESMFNYEEAAATRGRTYNDPDVYALLSEWTEGYVHFQEISWLNPQWAEKKWNEDKAFLAEKVNTSEFPELDWEPHISGCLKAWAYFSHGNGETNAVRWYRLGVHTEDANGSQNTTVIKGKTKSSLWYTGYRQTVNGAGYIIDTRNLSNADKAYWYATVTNGNGSDNYEVNEEENKLTKYKEVEAPSGSVYWCFSCDGDNDYTDLILLVKPVVVAKRYMIEDLGAIGDFDFNDIVVDVWQTSIIPNDNSNDISYETKAIVRAMGGQLDFTLTIGNTPWSKSEKFIPAAMYNTEDPINYQEDLDVFEVDGWNPAENNISVSVRNKINGQVFNITFPKAGEAPMIIAADPTRKWMQEMVSVPGEWWFVPNVTE